MNYKKLIAVTIALTVCALVGSNVTAHGGGGGDGSGGHGGGFGGGGGFRGGGGGAYGIAGFNRGGFDCGIKGGGSSGLWFRDWVFLGGWCRRICIYGGVCR